MILDSFKNSSLYDSICQRMKRAFELVAATDLVALPAGKHLLDGEDIFVNIMEVDLKKSADAKLEIHDVYADIQILLVGEEEGFGWSERASLNNPIAEFDREKDVQFWNDAHQTTYYLRKGQFTILMPEDAHAPMIGEGKVKKAIVKVRI
ncbi:MAG: YhcH/YjgK/YiaL family protein [Rikenellaceae bacterium]